MPRVIAKSDNLNDRNKEFQQHPLPHPVFLNSVPKCGTHLIRNIFRMFVPVDQQYHEMFIQIPVLKQHLNAFSQAHPKISWGHLLFSDDSTMALHGVKHLLIVRDPFDWVLARARFFLSDTFQGSMGNLKSGKISMEQILNMMIFGIYQKAPTMEEIFTHNAVSWMGCGTKFIRYEDVIKNLKNIETEEAREYFTDLLSICGIEQLPDDWQQRVKIGSDRKQSGTARENLSGLNFTVPDELPEMQKQLVEYAAPGLRKILGYN
ncbi:MAG: hypothetical protein GY781_01315 [Gammaproteobacteria bacterium]|nr:hypothetical protein [Gammaproteobacteria bacterium]